MTTSYNNWISITECTNWPFYLFVQLLSVVFLQDQHGTPILCAVCKGGFDRLLEKLLDKGADPNARDLAKQSKPAIVLAAEGNHHECVKLLMVSRVDANVTYDIPGICALHRYV